MKKTIALILATLVVVIGLAACGTNDDETTTNLDETTTLADETSSEETSSEGTSVAGDTLAKTLVEEFKTVAADTTLTAEQIATKLSESEAVVFGPMVMAVEEGLLTGFAEYEVKGFEEAAVFSPMIGTIPFMSYVFKLADGADVEAFKTSLTENAKLDWNICTMADEMIVESVGNTVFFIMAPTALD